MSEPTRILVVDDEPALLAATVRILRSAGFDVMEATTGAECLEVTRKLGPDLVLLDVVLPDIDGREVCREIKGDPVLKPTFVVLTSGERKSADDRVAGLDVGADGYILRPVGNRELLAWVQAFVRISEAEAALRHAQRQIEQRHALSLAASLDGMWEWDIASGTAQFSDRFAELLGYGPDEVPRTVDFLRGIIHPDDAEAVWGAVERHLDERTPYNAECRLRSKGGEYRWFLARGLAQWDPMGRATWMAGSIQDITEQKTAELALRNAFGEIEQLRDRLRAENIYLREEIENSHDFNEIVGQSDPLRLTLSKIEHVAGTDATVLLLGETGTGKELLARAIHNRSARRERPLVKVNCAALPRRLIESELFGHVKGAFTGAAADKVGRFELADGGSIFLDEIGELDADPQTKLLRVLQEGQFERIGSGETSSLEDVDRAHIVGVLEECKWRIKGEDNAAERLGLKPSTLRYRMKKLGIERPPRRPR